MASFVVFHTWSSCLLCSPVSRAAWSGIPVSVSSCGYAKKCLSLSLSLWNTWKQCLHFYYFLLKINWIFFLLTVWCAYDFLILPCTPASVAPLLTCFISVNDFKLCFFVITQYLNAESASAQLPRVLFFPVTYPDSLQLSNAPRFCCYMLKCLNQLPCLLTKLALRPLLMLPFSSSCICALAEGLTLAALTLACNVSGSFLVLVFSLF